VILVALALIVGVTEFYLHQQPAPNDGPDAASTAPAGPGYAFLARNRSGTPVRWNPCSPIEYQTNLAAAPAYAQADLTAALARVSQASGLRFVYEGSTDYFPADGPLIDPTDQLPVQIAWATPAQTAQDRVQFGPVRDTWPGRVQPVVAEDEITGHGVYVTGSVIIESPASRLAAGFGPGGLGNLWLHEIGGLVGLADVSTPGEVMNPEAASTQAGLGAGDLAGLQRVGSQGGCLMTPKQAQYEPEL
jgi:hypothetical protein